ncbi:hypothetical protein MNV49_001922 [Pseudohyphozyma bogoriensis]|nr:hypothetical protein MNV49_001922 [Pseudohyphozyma bogoriensis]
MASIKRHREQIERTNDDYFFGSGGHYPGILAEVLARVDVPAKSPRAKFIDETMRVFVRQRLDAPINLLDQILSHRFDHHPNAPLSRTQARKIVADAGRDLEALIAKIASKYQHFMETTSEMSCVYLQLWELDSTFAGDAIEHFEELRELRSEAGQNVDVFLERCIETTRRHKASGGISVYGGHTTNLLGRDKGDLSASGRSTRDALGLAAGLRYPGRHQSKAKGKGKASFEGNAFGKLSAEDVERRVEEQDRMELTAIPPPPGTTRIYSPLSSSSPTHLMLSNSDTAPTARAARVPIGVPPESQSPSRTNGMYETMETALWGSDGSVDQGPMLNVARCGTPVYHSANQLLRDLVSSTNCDPEHLVVTATCPASKSNGRQRAAWQGRLESLLMKHNFDVVPSTSLQVVQIRDEPAPYSAMPALSQDEKDTFEAKLLSCLLASGGKNVFIITDDLCGVDFEGYTSSWQFHGRRKAAVGDPLFFFQLPKSKAWAVGIYVYQESYISFSGSPIEMNEAQCTAYALALLFTAETKYWTMTTPLSEKIAQLEAFNQRHHSLVDFVTSINARHWTDDTPRTPVIHSTYEVTPLSGSYENNIVTVPFGHQTPGKPQVIAGELVVGIGIENGDQVVAVLLDGSGARLVSDDPRAKDYFERWIVNGEGEKFRVMATPPHHRIWIASAKTPSWRPLKELYDHEREFANELSSVAPAFRHALQVVRTETTAFDGIIAALTSHISALDLMSPDSA